MATPEGEKDTQDQSALHKAYEKIKQHGLAASGGAAAVLALSNSSRVFRFLRERNTPEKVAIAYLLALAAVAVHLQGQNADSEEMHDALGR